MSRTSARERTGPPAQRALSLLVLLLAASAAPLPAAAAASPGDPALDGMLLALQAATTDGRVDGAVFGWRAGATDGYDAGLDKLEPPTPPGGSWVQLSLVEPHAGTRLHRSLRPEADEVAWTVRVDAAGPSDAVSLRWDANVTAALPSDLALELWDGDAPHDMRSVAEHALAREGEAPTTHALQLVATRLRGPLPSAPLDLRATPGPLPGEVTLVWSEPAEPGLHPLRAYRVYRLEGDGGATLLGATRDETFRDAGRALGELARYHVRAVTLRGEGEPSDVAVAPGTGKPRLLQAPPENEGATLAEARTPATPDEVDGDARVVTVEAGPALMDPGRYEVGVALEGGPSHRVGVHTGVQVPLQERVTLVEAGEHGVPLRGSAAEARLSERAGCSGLVVTTGATLDSERRWDDRSATPCLP